ncbi:hypothetical protein [Lichenihabitans psoromatis]|uniref:hypothetical protein n=1 Tax=Lichenihabitans psoromatis TaxID=2528642 RepID=UPI00103843C4|nr:hypothetical protein [Lichenihabitans psoromatis]
MTDLSFSLGGDISAFERAMNLALTTGAKSANGLMTVFKASSDRIDKEFGTSLSGVIGKVTGLNSALGALKVAGGAFLAFEALKFVIDETNRAAEDAAKQLQKLVDIGNKAKDASVGTSFFQGFIGQAKELGVEASQLESVLTSARDAFKTNIGEGTGAASSTAGDRVQQNVLAGNLPASSATALAQADTVEAKTRVIIGMFDQLQQKGALLAEYDLASKIFGPAFETDLRNGGAQLEAMRVALDGMATSGGERVLSETEIANAQRIQAEYAAQNKAVADAWAPVEERIAEWKQAQLQSMADMRGLYEDVIAAVGRWASALANVDKYMSSIGNSSIFKNLVSGMNSLGLITDADIKRQLDAGKADADPNAAPPLTIRPKRDTSRSLPSLTPAASSGGSAAKPADPVDNLIKSLNKSAAAEAGEAAAIGKNNQAKQESIDLAKAEEAAKERGTALTEAERVKVLAAADAYSAAKKQIDDYNRSQEQAGEQAKFVGSTLESAVEGMVVSGNTFASTMQSIAKSLETAALKAALLGEGPLAGLLGTAPAAGATGSASVGGLLGSLISGVGTGGFQGWMPKFATGRVVGPGGGTSDQVPAWLSNGETVINARASAANAPLLEAINSGQPLRLAQGGVAGRITAAPASSGSGGEVSIQVIHNAPTAPKVTQTRAPDGKRMFQLMWEDAAAHSSATNGHGTQAIAKRAGLGRVG